MYQSKITQLDEAILKMKFVMRHQTRCSLMRLFEQQLRRGCVTVGVRASAGAAEPAGSPHEGEEAVLSLAEKILKFQTAFWKFLRPHTIRGTVLGTT